VLRPLVAGGRARPVRTTPSDGRHRPGGRRPRCRCRTGISQQPRSPAGMAHRPEFLRVPASSRFLPSIALPA